MKVLSVTVATYMALSCHLFELVEANQLNDNESSTIKNLNRKRTAPLAENMKPVDAIPQPILLSQEEEVFMRLVQEQNSLSFAPSTLPSSEPSSKPSPSPSAKPSPSPSKKPSSIPSDSPSKAPVVSPGTPTKFPSKAPTKIPSPSPSSSPTSTPTTGAPSPSPSKKPTRVPLPTTAPTKLPTKTPTVEDDKCTKSAKNCDKTPKPTDSPTASPSFSPTISAYPSSKPTSKPSGPPTHHPSSKPSARPTSSPSHTPSSKPSASPTISPTKSFSPTLPDVCKDSGTKMLLKRDGITKKRNCSWIEKNEDKRSLRCSLKEVASHCPNACNSVTTPNACEEYACQDSMMEWIRWGFDEPLNCDWVKVNPERRCAMNGVKATCRKTCEYANDFMNCPSAPSVPSAHPSSRPSSAPVI